MDKTWIILFNNTSDVLVRCTQRELMDILLDFNRDESVEMIEYFEYKSDEYYMFIKGDDYDIMKNYKNEIYK